MRVAMIGWEYPPFLSGGLGVHCFELSRKLADLGVGVDFYMPATRQEISSGKVNVIPVGPANRQEAEALALQGAYGGEAARTRNWWEKIQPIDLGFFDAVRVFNELCWKRLVANHEKRPYGAIHCHDWITVAAGVRAKQATGLPLVLTMHSTEYDRSANLWPMQWIVDLERLGVANADLIITVSERTKRELVERLGADERKIRVVYNAVDYPFFANPGKKRLAWESGVKTVLFHGRLSVQKGADYFLRAAKRALEKEKNVRFIVSGKGEQLPYLVKLAVDLGISDKVIFTGYFPEEDLPSLYASADAYVLPSVSEPFGITVLEAMSSGAPVILSKTAGVAEIAKNCLRVDFWDVDEMASLMLSLIKYPPLGREMAAMQRREASKLSWNDTAAKTVQVYLEAMQRVAVPVSG